MRNKFLTLIIIASIFLLFFNLGDRILFGDEAYTVLVSKTVVESGFPRGFYRDYVINPKETAYTFIRGVDVYTWISWLQYYLGAAGFALFGFNEFFLRFPFALFGLGTIILFYFFVKYATRNKQLALISTLLIATSVTFLLHSRQVRYYAPSTFFTIAILYSYLYFLKNSAKRFWPSFYFVFSSVFLFHSNFLVFFALFFALAIHFLIFNLKKIRKFVLPLFFIILFTFPWFLITGQLVKGSGLPKSFLLFVINLIIHYYYVFVLLFPLIFIIFIYYFGYCKRKSYRDKTFLSFIFIIIFFYILFVSLRSNQLATIRYLIPILPLFCFLNAYVIYYIKKYNKIIAISILILLIFTNVFNIFPFIFMKGFLSTSNIDRISDYERQKFVNDTLSLKYYFPNYIYELTHDYTSSEELIMEYMLTHGKEDDTFVTYDFEVDIVLYSNMKAVKINNSRVDWIILRDFKIDLNRTKKLQEQMKEYIDILKYDKIIIPSTDQRWANAPDPINHKFKTHLNGETTLYHLRD